MVEKLNKFARRATVPLRDLTRLCYRYPTFYGFEYQPAGILVLKGENITRDGEIVEVEAPSFIDVETHQRFPLTHLEEHDLIVSVRGEVGKVGLVPQSLAGSNINANTIRISLNDRGKGGEFEPSFIWEFLNCPVGQLLIRQFVAGGVQATITAPELLSVIIPALPIREQKKLVAAMDEARADRRKKLADADALLAGMDVFLVDTLGLKPPPEDTRRVFAIRMEQPRHQGRLNSDFYHPERINALRALEAAAGKLRVDPLVAVVTFERNQIKAPTENYLGLAHVQSSTGELVVANEDGGGTCFTFQKNDVLFGRLRPYLNKVYRAEMDGCCSPEFHVLRTRDAQALMPDYLAATLRSRLVLAQTIHMMTGNTHPRLTYDDVVNLRIPIPIPAVQRTIVEEVYRRRSEARRLRAEAEAGWQEAKRWFEEQLLRPTAP